MAKYTIDKEYLKKEFRTAVKSFFSPLENTRAIKRDAQEIAAKVAGLFKKDR